MHYPVTSHTLVKNDDQYIWYALSSVAPYVEKMLVWDTGSTDHTQRIIQEFINTHPALVIDYQIRPVATPHQIDTLREEQVALTKTPWLLLVDGDEIWPRSQLELLLAATTQKVPESTVAVVNHTRNCTGDIWHYLPDYFGHYHLKGVTGHLNLRLLKTLPYTVKGGYPDEGYYLNNHLINTLEPQLLMNQAWYLHTSHLKRSSQAEKPLGRRHRAVSSGIRLSRQELPEVFFAPRPSLVPDVTHARPMHYNIAAKPADSLRRLRSL